MDKLIARFRVEYHDRETDPICDIEETNGLSSTEFRIGGNLQFNDNDYVIKDILVETLKQRGYREYNVFITIYVLDATSSD